MIFALISEAVRIGCNSVRQFFATSEKLADAATSAAERQARQRVRRRYKFSSLLRKFALDMVFMNDLKQKLEYK